MSSLPAIFVVGPTGSGKTRLAVDLARACNGEIVNADVIQMYAGLDIASAKASTAERRGVPHHLLSFLPPCAAMTVRVFRALATAVIADIHARGRVPVIAGGSGYYVQALLRESLLEDAEAEALVVANAGAADGGGGATCVAAGAGASAAACGDGGMNDAGVDGATLHARLAVVDPVMARRLHPHDVRRISRALAVHASTGIPFSAMLARQAAKIEGAPGPFRSRVYWLTVDDRAEHDRRLDLRVSDMLCDGLASEIALLRAALTRNASAGAGARANAEIAGKCAGISTAIAGARDMPQAVAKDKPSDLTCRIVEEHAASLASVGNTNVAELTGSSYPAASVYAATVGELDPPGSYVGVLRAIGYKEFQEFLELTDAMDGTVDDVCAKIAEIERADASAPIAPFERKRARKSTVLADESADALAIARAALAQGAARLREVTHGYARRQDRWIRNRFESRGVPLVRLDTSAAAGGDRWETLISSRVVSDASAWLSGAPVATLLAPTRDFGGEGADGVVRATSDLSRIVSWEQHTCDVCGGRLINGALAWTAHIKSKAHKTATRRASRRWEERPSDETAVSAATQAE
jgi:tRNA dimethylallyltransferase